MDVGWQDKKEFNFYDPPLRLWNNFQQGKANQLSITPERGFFMLGD